MARLYVIARGLLRAEMLEMRTPTLWAVWLCLCLTFVRLASAQAQEAQAQEAQAPEARAQTDQSSDSASPDPAASTEPPRDESQPGQGAEDELEPGGLEALLPPDNPAWTWTQILVPPRIRGQTRSVAVDPNDPDKIYVGTQEGTVLRTSDGGAIWEETELDPYVRERTLAIPRPPGLPDLGEVGPPGFTFFQDPPFRAEPVDRVSPPFRSLFFGFAPEFMSVRATPPTTGAPQVLLRDAISQQPVGSVRRVIVCPGGEYPIIAATEDELLGSSDEGRTYVRLLRVPGGVTVYHVACSSFDPNQLYVTTSFGPFLSKDGGITFAQDLSGWPGRAAHGAAFSPTDPNKTFVATDHVLFQGDATSKDGLEMCYPDFNNASTAPWTTINWIEPDGEGIWLATDDGVRYSPDGGTTWKAVAPTLFNHHVVRQVTVGQNEAGGKRVAVALRDSPPHPPPPPYRKEASSPAIVKNPHVKLARSRTLVYASDDNGETWFPFFQGMTRRILSQMIALPKGDGDRFPRWWIVAGGGVWATQKSATASVSRVKVYARWARRKLRADPPMVDVIRGVLKGARLLPEQVDYYAKRQHQSYRRLPEVEVRLASRTVFRNRDAEIVGSTPALISGTSRYQDYRGWLVLSWDMPSFVMLTAKRGAGKIDYQLRTARVQIHELRRTMAFAVEDIWHERRKHLQTLVHGASSPLEAESLKNRVETLEVILETWMPEGIRRESRNDRT